MNFLERFDALRGKSQGIDLDMLEERLAAFRPEALCGNGISNNGEEKFVIDSDESIDLVRGDFLSFSKDAELRKVAKEMINIYGVGTCGPRSFFGSTDRHKVLEKKLAAFLGTEMAFIYPFGPLTTGSVIGTYLHPSFVAFVDEDISDEIKNGLACTKCTIYFFKHNDSNDLFNLLDSMKQFGKLEKFEGKFLILEGIYAKTGDLCKLRSLLKIAKQFMIRIILDESYSFGILGATGRGITEYCSLDVDGQIDFICGNLEHSFGIIGGFCVGSQRAIENQYILSLSFVYSASLPVFLVQTLSECLDRLKNRPNTLQTFSREMHDFLADFELEFKIASHFDSPLKIITPTKPNLCCAIADLCKRRGVYLRIEADQLRINLNHDLYTDKTNKKKLYETLKACAEFVNDY